GKIPDGLMKTSIPAQEGYLQIDNNHLGTHSVSEEMEIWLNARNHGWENSQNSDGCPGTLQFTKATYSVGESDGNVTITVKRVDGNSGEVTVKCNTSDDTAMAEKDYTETTNTLKWKDGNNAGKDCEIEIIDDDKHEEKETFIISLGEPKNGADLGTPDTAVVTINDND
ncbi:MAG: Calx-beta domain-containing protein, partial [Pseudomonadota bacterium]